MEECQFSLILLLQVAKRTLKERLQLEALHLNLSTKLTLNPQISPA